MKEKRAQWSAIKFTGTHEKEEEWLLLVTKTRHRLWWRPSEGTRVKRWPCLHAHRAHNYWPQDVEPAKLGNSDAILHDGKKGKARRASRCQVRNGREGNVKASFQLCVTPKPFFFVFCRVRRLELKNPFCSNLLTETRDKENCALTCENISAVTVFVTLTRDT